MAAVDEMENKLLLVKRHLNALAAAAAMLDGVIPDEAVPKWFKVFGISLSEAKALVEKHFTCEIREGGSGAWRQVGNRTEACALLIGEHAVELAITHSKPGDLRAISGRLMPLYRRTVRPVWSNAADWTHLKGGRS